MKLLPAPFGWDSYGVVVRVQLSLIGGPRLLGPFHTAAIIDALANHSCYPGAWRKVIGCLEHSVYQCLMREPITKEVLRSGALARALVHFEVLGYLRNGTDLAHQGAQLATSKPLYTPAK